MDERVIRRIMQRGCAKFGMLGALGISVLIATGDDGVGKGDCVTTDGSVRSTRASRNLGRGKPLRGGFSNIFKRPEYQEQAVTTFLQRLGNQYEGNYKRYEPGNSRPFRQAYRYPLYIGGKLYLGMGTSAAHGLCVSLCPLSSLLSGSYIRRPPMLQVVASVISLLNDYLISEGKVTLGFLNPGWRDGYPATGIGTPDFQRMLSVLPDSAEPGGAG
ncbi:hypothetical protein EDB84DRAFT_1579557 [Lactarius hengduanensis]|nr:hypothetical protein EDB84DRAFT_1579557 [Lactarius hengduanensis]